MSGSHRFMIKVTVSIVVTLLIVACSSNSNSEPQLTTTAVSTTLPTTGGRAVPTLAPDLPSTPSAPPPEEPIATPTLTVPDPATSATQPTVRVAPPAPTALPIQPPTPLSRPTPRVAAAPRPSITSVTSPVNRGSTAIVTVMAGPRDSCSIRVTVPGGVTASANGLGNKLADGSGRVSWSWVVGPATPLGTGQVAVKCGSSAEATAALIIR